MFFATWWQGLVFGVVTTIAMLAICYAFVQAWKKYEQNNNHKPQQSCDAHH